MALAWSHFGRDIESSQESELFGLRVLMSNVVIFEDCSPCALNAKAPLLTTSLADLNNMVEMSRPDQICGGGRFAEDPGLTRLKFIIGKTHSMSRHAAVHHILVAMVCTALQRQSMSLLYLRQGLFCGPLRYQHPPLRSLDFDANSDEAQAY